MNDIPLDKKTIFLDFDGTLVDVRKRLYKLFVFMAGADYLSYEEYWHLKKIGLTQKDLLLKIGYKGRHDTFSNIWLEKVEEKEWLRYDTVFNYTHVLLNSLKSEYRRVLWTNRQNKENLIWELDTLGLINKFDKILVTEQKCTKSELISEFSTDINNIVVGDSLEDEQAAVDNNLNFFFIRDYIKYRNS